MARKMFKDHHEKRLFSIWNGMKNRCYRKNTANFKHYGGRGISVADAWMDFDSFYRNMRESYVEHVGEYGEKNTTLDRIDNSKGYSLENCRWETMRAQSANTRRNKFFSLNGTTKHLAEWSRDLNQPYAKLYKRIFYRKWTLEKALTTL